MVVLHGRRHVANKRTEPQHIESLQEESTIIGEDLGLQNEDLR
jgi:hypothetical protein